jgi:endo-1,4-beta-xylanase
MRRRDFLQAGLLCGAAEMLRPYQLQAMLQITEGQPTLKSLALAKGITIGGQVEQYLLRQPAIADFVTQNYSIITPGMELKWERIHKAPKQFDFSGADWMINFAQTHGLEIHGHNLCWDVSNPQWLTQTLNKQNAKSILEDHIHTVVGRYRGKIASWDVVNEPIHGNRRPDLFNPGPWLDALGESYIDIAFNAAAAADPKAVLVMNIDYVEQGPSNAWRDAYIALIKRLLGRNVPVQAIGLESHLSTKSPVQSPQRDAFIKEIRALGLSVMITECDVDYASTTSNPQARLQTIASYYHDYLVDVIPVGQIQTVIFWTVADRSGFAMAGSTPVPKFTGLVRSAAANSNAANSKQVVENPALSAIRSALTQISSVK